MSLLDQNNLQELKKLAQEVCQRESCRLYDLEFTGGEKSRVLRVFILGMDQTVGLEQCAEVSRGLGWLLDTQEHIIQGDSCGLEVSSPGVERTLKEKWHFEEALQELVKVNLNKALENLPDGIDDSLTRKFQRNKQIRGTIVKVLDHHIVLDFDKHFWEVPFDNIKKAQVIYDFKKVSYK